MDFDDILGVLEGILDGQGTAKEKENQLADIIGNMYDSLVKKYRPVIRVIPLVSDKISKDLAPLFVSLLRFVNLIREDKKLQQEIQRSRNITANQRFEALKTYEKAGFSREEAMALVLQDAVNAFANLAKLGNITPNTQKSERKTYL